MKMFTDAKEGNNAYKRFEQYNNVLFFLIYTVHTYMCVYIYIYILYI